MTASGSLTNNEMIGWVRYRHINHDYFFLGFDGHRKLVNNGSPVKEMYIKMTSIITTTTTLWNLELTDS